MMDILFLLFALITGVSVYEYRKWSKGKAEAEASRLLSDAVYQKWLADLDALKERRRSSWEAHNDLLRARTMCDLGLVIHHFQGSYEEWQAIKVTEQSAVELERLVIGAGYATQGFAAMKHTAERMKP